MLDGRSGDCASFRSAASCGTGAGSGFGVDTSATASLARSPSGDCAAAAVGAAFSAPEGFPCFALPPPRDGPRPPRPLPFDPESTPLGTLQAGASGAPAGCESRRSRGLAPSCHPLEGFEVSARCASGFTAVAELVLLVLVVVLVVVVARPLVLAVATFCCLVSLFLVACGTG